MTTQFTTHYDHDHHQHITHTTNHGQIHLPSTLFSHNTAPNTENQIIRYVPSKSSRFFLDEHQKSRLQVGVSSSTNLTNFLDDLSPVNNPHQNGDMNLIYSQNGMIKSKAIDIDLNYSQSRIIRREAIFTPLRTHKEHDLIYKKNQLTHPIKLEHTLQLQQPQMARKSPNVRTDEEATQNFNFAFCNNCDQYVNSQKFQIHSSQCFASGGADQAYNGPFTLKQINEEISKLIYLFDQQLKLFKPSNPHETRCEVFCYKVRQISHLILNTDDNTHKQLNILTENVKDLYRDMQDVPSDNLIQIYQKLLVQLTNKCQA